MSLDSALTIANSGLHDIGAQLATISNNVANASTAGYALETQQQTSVVAGNQATGCLPASSCAASICSSNRMC